ncbi:MAG: hypothetical protein IH996_09335 [Proteobacteria bacterium]|nr:hypothetical protein [Pseudomonadota bacterium]
MITLAISKPKNPWFQTDRTRSQKSRQLLPDIRFCFPVFDRLYFENYTGERQSGGNNKLPTLAFANPRVAAELILASPAAITARGRVGPEDVGQSLPAFRNTGPRDQVGQQAFGDAADAQRHRSIPDLNFKRTEQEDIDLRAVHTPSDQLHGGILGHSKQPNHSARHKLESNSGMVTNSDDGL